jgi:multidrug efflux pump subunit AcrA (membrane-fusion protein)
VSASAPRPWRGLGAIVILAAAACGAPPPAVETTTITRGEYTDILEIRGDIRARRTTLVAAPRNAGELVILKLARNGSTVKAGDVVAEFDAVTMRRTIADKQSELRSAQAEAEQAKAQGAITLEERQAAVRRATFDVERAKLAIGDVGLVSEIEAERGRLSLADAEQRLREAEAALDALRASQAADATSRARRMAKTQADLERAQEAVRSLAVTAPTDGTVSIMPNYRMSSPMGVAQEFRPGDRTFSGAYVLELPDLTEVLFAARLDEADRGPIRMDQTAVLRADAVADREYHATVREVSVLARVDFSGGWPPPKQFDLTLGIDDTDGRLRPGMSAIARIAVGRLPDVLLVPAKAVFGIDGQNVVFVARRGAFERVPVTVIRRGRDQAAIDGAVREGDTIALARPDEAAAGVGK